MTPASIRNNNPGAIYPGPSARKFGGASKEVLRSADGKHLIATFPTAVHGAAALFDNLMNARSSRTSYYYRGKTLSEAIATWCGGIRAPSYLRLIEQHAGLAPDVVLSEAFLHNPDKAIPLAQAMARHEAGQDYPLDDAGWRRAHSMAFAGGDVAPAPSPANDVPTVRPEARAENAAAEVSKPAAVGTATAAGTLTWLSGNIPSVDTLASWQASASKLGEVTGWALTNWKTVIGAGVAYVLTCHVLPWWAKERV